MRRVCSCSDTVLLLCPVLSKPIVSQNHWHWENPSKVDLAVNHLSKKILNSFRVVVLIKRPYGQEGKIAP